MMACINPSHWDRGVMMLCAWAHDPHEAELLHDFSPRVALVASQGGVQKGVLLLSIDWLQGNPTVTVRRSTPAESNSPSSGGYDATHFGEAKHAGKDKVNRFLRQIALRTDGMALLLDDVDPRSKKLRSAAELGKAFPFGSIIVPNPDESIVQIAQRMGLRGLTKTWAEALDDLPAESTLGLAYYDSCDQGDWSVSEQNLKKVIPHMLAGGVIACTLRVGVLQQLPWSYRNELFFQLECIVTWIYMPTYIRPCATYHQIRPSKRMQAMRR